MMKPLVLTLLGAALLCGEMKVEPAGAPPQEAAALASAVSEQGLKVLKDGGGVLLEAWFVKALPSGGAAEENSAFPDVPHGALLGVIRFPERHADRRGQTIKPGVYTLRYSRYPVDGAHMGVAPQRDFAVLTVTEKDNDPAARPNFARLMSISRVASGTPHPLVLSIWKEEPPIEPGIEAHGDEERVLHTRIGSVSFAIIIAGQGDH